MIKQKAKGLNSRSEADPYNKDNMLPLITAPMYSVVSGEDRNYKEFLNRGIQVCLPRNQTAQIEAEVIGTSSFISVSLNRFIKDYIDSNERYCIHQVCIDTANGNMPKLHDAIRKAKKRYGDNLIIMAGNVSSVKAFAELAKTGVDYIRVGVGGGGGCNTTSNTGIGQEGLEELVKLCSHYVTRYSGKGYYPGGPFNWNIWMGTTGYAIDIPTEEEKYNIANVKIIADGISTYVKQCEKKYGFNDNGYAAINKLLYAGADLVMIGRLFAQSSESAGKKRKKGFEYIIDDFGEREYISFKGQEVLYSGMSTQKEQQAYNEDIKPSEGSTTWLPVRWTLDEWLFGSKTQDEAPYLSGWVNTIKSAMSYVGAKTLNNFHE